MNRRRWMILSAVLLLGSGAVAASPDGGRPLPGVPGEPPPLPSERIDAELAYMETALKVTPQQTGQWDRVADVLRNMARHREARILAMRASFDGAAGLPPDPIAALERRQSGLAEESRDLADLIAAAKPLYASLGADQKKQAGWLLGPAAGPGLPPPMLGPGPARQPPFGGPLPQ